MMEIYIDTEKSFYFEDYYSKKTFYHLEIKKIPRTRNKIIECYHINGFLEIHRLERNGILLYSNLINHFNYLNLIKYYI
jgi:hypothetical protein